MGIKKRIIIVILLVFFILLCMTLYNEVIKQKDEQVLQPMPSLDVSDEKIEDGNTKSENQKAIYDSGNDEQNGYIEIYDDKLVYMNDVLGYSFELPKSWEDRFVVDIDYNSKYMAVNFLGKSKESKSIMPNGDYRGLTIFEIIYETDFDKYKYKNVFYLGTVDDIKLYHVEESISELSYLYDEIYYYEDGVSSYQDDFEEINLIRKDIETVEKMLNTFDYTKINFKVLE